MTRITPFPFLHLLRLLPAILILCTPLITAGQSSLRVNQYTSEDGLPQNSIKDMALDHLGFLWIASEGGISRFDGHSFRSFTSADYSFLHSGRFTHAIPCQDSSILLMDGRTGIYRLKDGHINMVQPPGSLQLPFYYFLGTIPNVGFMMSNSLFHTEIRRINQTIRFKTSVFPVAGGQFIITSNRVTLIDTATGAVTVVEEEFDPEDRIIGLEKDVLMWRAGQGLSVYDKVTKKFNPCVILDEEGSVWRDAGQKVDWFSRFPFQQLFCAVDDKLYMLQAGPKTHQYRLQKLIDHLPENTTLTSVLLRQPEGTILVGTNTRGLFSYQYEPISTLHLNQPGDNTSLYAQILLPGQKLLTSYGLILDANLLTPAGQFPVPFYHTHLATDYDNNLYYTENGAFYRYDLQGQQQPTRIAGPPENPIKTIVRIDSLIWVGGSTGLGYVSGDSIHWWLRTGSQMPFRFIQNITRDHKNNLWYSTPSSLHRMDWTTGKVDTFHAFDQKDCRTLEVIGDKVFVGTYGHGYYVIRDNSVIRMPVGRHGELQHVHSFIRDGQNYIWMPTNQGLFKTSLEAIDAFLEDTLITLDYYQYLEEDGIHNREFNGGCLPSYIWLPDGRISLPTIDGLVLVDPDDTPHYFPGDSLPVTLNSRGIKPYQQGVLQIPAFHQQITFDFAGPSWNNLYNHYVYYKLEGLHERFHLARVGESSYSIAALKPGEYTFVVKKRTGLMDDDFVYSRLHFIVRKPWYATNLAFALYALLGFALTWGGTLLYTHTIRQRNAFLQQKVAEHTASLRDSNNELETNVRKLAASELLLKKNIGLRDKLISILSHDILTPLRFISRIARLGNEQDPGQSDSKSKALSDVQNAVDKLYHSTQNLLHWVRFHQDNFKVVPISCSPFAITEQLIEEFGEMATFNRTALHNMIPEDDVIRTDPNILRIILHNLISNAIKFSPSGEIHIRSAIQHPWYILDVRDTGRGMSEAQLDIARNTEDVGVQVPIDLTAGNGIGLRLVADLVKAVNGRWEIDSPGHQGVIVSIYLPLDPVPES